MWLPQQYIQVLHVHHGNTASHTASKPASNTALCSAMFSSSGRRSPSSTYKAALLKHRSASFSCDLSSPPNLAHAGSQSFHDSICLPWTAAVAAPGCMYTEPTICNFSSNAAAGNRDSAACGHVSSSGVWDQLFVQSRGMFTWWPHAQAISINVSSLHAEAVSINASSLHPICHMCFSLRPQHTPSSNLAG
jgi:hypothetical protein